MLSDIRWPLILTEMGLVILSLACLVWDTVLPAGVERGKRLANAAMVGVAMLFFLQSGQVGHFGLMAQGTFVQDGVSWFFKLLFLLAAFFALFMTREYQSQLKRGHGEFPLLILFALLGMLFLASANDFLLFFISLETLTVSLYVMTAYLRDKNASIEAGVKYLVLGALSTAIFLYGLSFIYGATGGTSYVHIQQRLAELGHWPKAFSFGMILVIASLGFKIAAVPFQLWAPDIYEGAPTPVAAFLSMGSKAAGFAALARLLLTVFVPTTGMLTTLFAALAALTILYGNLGAIPQTNIKRLLGYSSIGHSGYLLIGLAAFAESGSEAVLFYLLSYVFSVAGAFLVLIAISHVTKTDEIGELAGLSSRSPVLAAGMLLSLLSLAGVPPLAGFFAKFYVLWAGIQKGLLWLVVIGVLNVITSLYYYLKIVKVMYVDKPKDAAPLKVGIGAKFMQYFSIAGILFLGVFPGPIVHLIEQAFLNFQK